MEKNITLTSFMSISTILFVPLIMSSAHAKTCRLDPDDDGYFSTNAPSFDAPSCAPMGVPDIAEYSGDCQPYSSSIHPRRTELQNGRDDNCNGRTDEPTLRYYSDTANPGFHAHIPAIEIEINDDATLDVIRDGLSEHLHYRVTINDLESNRTRVVYGMMDREDILIPRSIVYFGEDDWGLEFNTPYSIDFTFVDEYGYALSDKSNLFYTATGASREDPNLPLEDLRNEMLWNGFQQLLASQRGEIGTLGTDAVDGTRFGAGAGESWCDEFYAANAFYTSEHEGFEGMNPDHIRHWFRDPQRDGYYTMMSGPSGRSKRVPAVDNAYYDDGLGSLGRRYWDADLSDISLGERGDFLLAQGHAGMFVAYNWDTGKVVSLEGNVGNKVRIVRRRQTAGAAVPYPGTNREYWVGIGRLKESMFYPLDAQGY